MDISFVGGILGTITGLATVAVWLYKLYIWANNQISIRNERAARNEEIATQLLSRATTTERRQDIHTYLQLTAIEIQGEKTRRLILIIASSLSTILLIFASLRFFRANEVPFALKAFIGVVGTGTIIFLALLFLLNGLIKKYEGHWQSGVNKALGIKIDKHMSKSESA